MGVYAHRFIEIQDKDNKWQAQPLWSKYEESNYCQPDLVVGELKLKKNLAYRSKCRLKKTGCSSMGHFAG